MNSSQLATIDPFADSVDGIESIGSTVGRRRRAKAKAKVNAKAVKRGIDKARTTVRKVKNTAKDVRKVTRNPVVVGVVGATAAVVPAGTVVAGVATVGLAAAEAIMAIADSKVGQAIGKGVGGAAKAIGGALSKKQAKNNRSKRAREYARRIIKAKNLKDYPDSIRKFKALLAKGVNETETIQKAKQRLGLDKRAAQVKKKAATMPRAAKVKVLKKAAKRSPVVRSKIAQAANKARLRAEFQKGTSELAKVIAKIMIAADRGNAQAVADLAALRVLGSPDGIANAVQVKSLAAKTADAKKVVRARGALNEAFMREAWKKAALLASAAEKRNPPPPKAKARNQAVQRQVEQTVRKSRQKLIEAASRVTRKQGVRVDPETKRAKAGQFSEKPGASVSYLVSPTGLVEKGRWS